MRSTDRERVVTESPVQLADGELERDSLSVRGG